jgi:hypothetical protein
MGKSVHPSIREGGHTVGSGRRRTRACRDRMRLPVVGVQRGKPVDRAHGRWVLPPMGTPIMHGQHGRRYTQPKARPCETISDF